MLIQPLPLSVQLSTSGFMPFTGSSNLLLGLAMTVVAVKRLEMDITLIWVVTFVLHLVATTAILIGRTYLFSSLAFLAPVAAEEISSTVIEGSWLLGTFSLSGMPSSIQILLITILPEGLMSWFPTLSLLGRPPLGLPGYYPIIFALLVSLTAGYIFRKGLKYYVQKGSNRYVPYGFRR